MTEPSKADSATRLSATQRRALELLVEQESHGYRNGEGVCTVGQTCLDGGQAWIHFQTARALERRGLVSIRYAYDYPDIWLEDAGRALVA